MATSKANNYSFHDEVKEVLYDVVCGSDEYFEDVVKTLAPTDNQKLTIDQRFGGLSIFKHPCQLVGTDENNKLVINDQAISQISSVDVALNIVAVTGLYRTGKSYLMNILANEKKGFMVGSRVAAQTKGIWAWCKQHPRHPDEVLLLLDTEGMSDPKKGDADHDNRLFCLTILLSSTMIYNHSGVFNHDSLQKLSILQITNSSGRQVKLFLDGQTAEAVKRKDPRTLMLLQRLCDKSSSSSTVGEEPEMLTEPTEELQHPSPSENLTPSEDPVKHSSNENNTSWTTASTKVLLDNYEENKTKTNKWQVVATSLKTMGYSTSAEKCRLKVRSLEDKYKRQVKHNNTSGNNAITIDPDLERVFGPDKSNLENLEPPLQSSHGSKGIKRKLDVPLDDETVNEKQNEKKTDGPSIKKETRRQSSSVHQVMQYMQQRDERMEKQHAERNELLKQLITALKDK